MVPFWVRALLAADRLADRAHALEARLRDEILWACVPEAGRDALTSAIYARQQGYAPGGARFEAGLFEWEARLLEHPRVPRGGRVLLGGAGGGRELRALCERGYQVTAFEPCEALEREARSVAAAWPGARVVRGAYRDLGAAVEGEGALVSLRVDAPYTLVIAGWRSLSHVLDAGDRLAVFKAFASLAPDAPTLVSFLSRRGAPRPEGRAVRAIRRTLARSGAPASLPDGAAFIPSAGFAVALARAEMEEIAVAIDRELVVCETEGEGVALLVPRMGRRVGKSGTSALSNRGVL
jgi:hypothetical protein